MGNSFPFPGDETSRSVCVWFRNKRDLIEQFIDSLDHFDDVEDDSRAYIAKKRKAELTAIIEDEKLDSEGTHELVERAFRSSGIHESGTEVVDLMTKKPSRFGEGGAYAAVKQRILDKLKAFYERFAEKRAQILKCRKYPIQFSGVHHENLF